MCDSTTAVSLHLWQIKENNNFQQFSVLLQPWSEAAAESNTESCHSYSSTNLPTGLNVDCNVIHMDQEEAVGFCMEQQHEGGIAVDVLGQKQRTWLFELEQATVKRHHKLICHQQSFVFLEDKNRHKKIESLNTVCFRSLYLLFRNIISTKVWNYFF